MVDKIKRVFKPLSFAIIFIVTVFLLYSYIVNRKVSNRKEIPSSSKGIYEEQSSSSDVVKIEGNYTVKIISRGKVLERKCFSPDGLNYIRMVTDGQVLAEEEYLIEQHAYLNEDNTEISSEILYDLNQFDFLNKSIVWLNNDEVIIDGYVIYNIKTKNKRFIKQPEDVRYSANYSVNGDASKIAYTTFGYSDNITVYIYNIKEDSWTTIYNKKYEGIAREVYWYELPVFWDCDDNVYFGVDEYSDLKRQYIDVVNIYNTRDKTLKSYAQEAVLLYCSPDNRYIVIGDTGQDRTVITDTRDKKKYEVGSVKKIFFKPYGNIFVYIPKDDVPMIVKCKENGQVDECKININNLEKGFSGYYNFQWENDELMFSMTKYTTDDVKIGECIIYGVKE